MIQELRIAIQSVIEAGISIKSIYETDFQVHLKSLDNPVTEADLSSHRIIKQCLNKNFPYDPLLSEEDLISAEDRLSKDRVWILDPIDGTREFVSRTSEFAVSLGLVFNNIAVLGVIYNPITQEMFWGARNVGTGNGIWNRTLTRDSVDTFINETKIENTESNAKIESRKKIIFVSNSEFKNNLFSELVSLESFKSDYLILPKGSIAYKLGLLFTNKADLVLSLKPKNEWDICGGTAILDLAGFKTFSILEPSPYRFNQKETITYGLLAGRKSTVEKFWFDYKTILQKSLIKSTQSQR